MKKSIAWMTDLPLPFCYVSLGDTAVVTVLPLKSKLDFLEKRK